MRNFNEGQVKYNDFGKSEQRRTIEPGIISRMCERDRETLKLPETIQCYGTTSRLIYQKTF